MKIHFIPFIMVSTLVYLSASFPSRTYPKSEITSQLLLTALCLENEDIRNWCLQVLNGRTNEEHFRPPMIAHKASYGDFQIVDNQNEEATSGTIPQKRRRQEKSGFYSNW